MNYEKLSKEEKIKYNKELVKKYPFLLPHNRWTDKVDEDYDYSYTELDALERGWRKAFGEEMCAEIEAELEKYDYQDKFRISQLKEKYGSMRLYNFGAPGDVEKIISKYELRSMHTCVRCGEPATQVSRGWICPWCDDCAKESGLLCDPIEEED